MLNHPKSRLNNLLMTSHKPTRRSSAWLDSPDLYGWLRRAALKSEGFSKQLSENRPIIGICNTWSELTHCNIHLRDLAESVKQGVESAGGLPLEFPVMSLGEYNMVPTAMMYRNLLSMEVEESILANPLDGVVLLAGCDKTTPALLMGATSANIPAILVTGGPQLKSVWRGEELGTCTDCRRYQQELRSGNITNQDWEDLQNVIINSPGHCGVMGTASTMAAIGEALGIALPGNTSIPAAHPERHTLARKSGKTIIDMVNHDIYPRKILTENSFINAIRVIHAIGGSTNAIVHLIAIAGRAGINLPLSIFDKLSKTTPLLVNLKPSGKYLMEDFHKVGGLQAVLSQLNPILNSNVENISGKTLDETISDVAVEKNDVIHNLNNPISTEGGLAVLHGSLAPNGAIIKQTAASPNLLNHQGRAVVFENHEDMENRIDDPRLDVCPEDILVMRNSGPIGGPGMPEWGLIPIPKKLAKSGVKDMVRISDARISGTAFGTVVVHVTPESAIGGPIAAVQNGDLISIDVSERKLDILVSHSEIERRLKESKYSVQTPNRGYQWLYSRHILQADKGCDFDFLRPDYEN